MKILSLLLQAALAVAVATATVSGVARTTGTPAPAKSASPARKELVKKVIQLEQGYIESIGPALAAQTAGQMMQMASQPLERLPPEKQQAVLAEMSNDVRKFQGELAPILKASAVKMAPSVLGPALEEKFTEDELKVLAAWLESPVSRKYQQFAGDMQQALVQKVVEDTRKQVEPKLKALEGTIMGRVHAAAGMPAGGAKGADQTRKK